MEGHNSTYTLQQSKSTISREVPAIAADWQEHEKMRLRFINAIAFFVELWRQLNGFTCFAMLAAIRKEICVQEHLNVIIYSLYSGS